MVDHPVLVLLPPQVPYAFEILSDSSDDFSWLCLFNESFLVGYDWVEQTYIKSLFDSSSKECIYSLDNRALNGIQEIANMIKKEVFFDRIDVLRLYLYLLLRQMVENRTQHIFSYQTAANNIVKKFFSLLDCQFPVDPLKKKLELRYAADFANRLSIHVNYLNRVIKSVTGSTTSDIINERIVQESVWLLKFSQYTVSEIAWGMGFEEISSFSKYIKKHTGISPTELRTYSL